VQDYVNNHAGIDSTANDKVNVHIPVMNELTTESIVAFRKLSLETMRRLGKQGGFYDGGRKPK
jgi:hypothetical protein